MEKICILAGATFLAVFLAVATGGAQDHTSRPEPSRTESNRPDVFLCAGRVIHRGQAVEGARVHVLWISHPELPASLVRAIDPNPDRKIIARSKAKGRFRIAVTHRGPFALFASSGELRSPLLFPVIAGDFRELTLEKKPVIAGTVVDADGQPVAGADVSQATFSDPGVYLEKFRQPTPVDTVQTDGSGNFRLPIWAALRQPAFNHRSMRAWTKDLVSVDRFYLISGQTDCDADLRLSRRTMLRGQLVSPNGTPIANATITDPFETGRSVHSDDHGRFSFANLRSGALVVHAPGYQRRRISWSEEADVGRIRLQPGIRLDLRLRRNHGALDGRRVVFASPLSFSSHSPWTGMVGKDGSLRIEGLTPHGPLSAFVQIGGRFVQFLSCVPDVDRNLGEIRVSDERTIQGQVNDVDRRPVAGARVILQPHLAAEELGRGVSRSGSILSRVTYSDHAGRFRFDAVIAGRLILAVNAGGDGFHTVQLPASAGGKAKSPMLAVNLETGDVLTGVVRTVAGKPAAGASVQYIMSGLTDESRLGTYVLRTITDSKGRFRFRGLPPHRSFTSYAMYVEKGRGSWSQQSGSYPADAVLHHTLKVHSGRYGR